MGERMKTQNKRDTLGSRQCAAAATIITFSAIVLFLYSVAHARSQLADFAGPWTACRMLRGNPYDIATVARLQEHLAAHKVNLQIMANPPWTALLFLPYSTLPYAYATALWVVTSVAMLWGIAIYFWRIFGEMDNIIALGITFGFAPTFFLMAVAQIDIILLLAIVLCLIGIRRSNWLLAGAGMALFSVKPQFMLIPALSIFLWSVKNRHWRLLTWGVLILAAMITAVLLLNHAVLSQWRAFLSVVMMPFGKALPTLPNLLGLLNPWLRYLPLLCGVAFAAYRALSISKLDWKFELPLMTAVGLATSFYGFYHDQVLALPLLLYSYAFGSRRIFLVLFCTANALIYIQMEFFQMIRVFPVWTAPAWLLIWFVCTSIERRNVSRLEKYRPSVHGTR